MSCRCGCCEGVERSTPASVENRPGLPALAYRVGTHATFRETMQAALSAVDLGGGANPLRALTSRDPADFSLALLDAWATVADVLSFYEERIANEGYLRTATERRSVLELARLIGYRLRPGVAASTYLAFTLEPDHELRVPRGTRAQSVPGPGELPQPFETSEELEARAEWNVLRPRTTAPLTLDLAELPTQQTIYLAGLPAVKQGSPLLLVDRAAKETVFCRAQSVESQPDRDRTKVVLLRVGAEQSGPQLLAAVHAAAERALEDPAARKTATGRRVARLLAEIAAAAEEGAEPAALATALREKLLPTLRHEYELAQGFARLQPWIGAVLAELTRLANRLAAGGAAPGFAAPEHATPELPALAPASAGSKGDPDAFAGLGRLIAPLLEPPSIPPRNRFALRRSIDALAPPGDAAVRVLGAFYPALRPKVLYGAWGKLTRGEPGLEVYLLKLTAGPYGQNAVRPPKVEDGVLLPIGQWDDWQPATDEDDTLLYLEGEHIEITQQSFAVIERPSDFRPTVYTVDEVSTRGRSAYGLSGKATVLTLDRAWWHPSRGDVVEAPSLVAFDGFDVVRRTVVHAASERLQLAQAPVEAPVQGDEIDLDGIFDGLTPGRWLIVTGERLLDPVAARVEARRLKRARAQFARAGLPLERDAVVSRALLPTVPAAELVMLGGVAQRVGVLPGRSGKLPGDTPRTWLTLARKLAYTYVRDTVRIYANVVDSTNGESRREVLGSGDAASALQRFQLKAKPLTYVSAPTTDGAASTLEVRVDGVRWHEAPGLAAMGPRDRSYLTETADDGTTSVVFGDGRRGERLPTGVENLTAVYRNGIGKGANLDAGRITQLASKPLGLKDVTNPLPATGGADSDSRDAARQNAPLSVTALDRLVSLGDYEDFTRLYAGIGKASAVALADGRRRLVHVTIAGADDIPIAPTSDLFANLVRSLRAFGDPHLPVLVAMRELLLLVIAAKVRVRDDYLWELVEPQVRSRLGGTFGFDRRGLGQGVTASEVVAAIQAVPGVDYVDLDVLDAVGLPGTKKQTGSGGGLTGLKLRQRVRAELARVEPVPSAGLAAAGGLPSSVAPARGAARVRRILPAQLAILKVDVPETLVLSELPR